MSSLRLFFLLSHISFSPFFPLFHNILRCACVNGRGWACLCYYSVSLTPTTPSPHHPITPSPSLSFFPLALISIIFICCLLFPLSFYLLSFIPFLPFILFLIFPSFIPSLLSILISLPLLTSLYLPLPPFPSSHSPSLSSHLPYLPLSPLPSHLPLTPPLIPPLIPPLTSPHLPPYLPSLPLTLLTFPSPLIIRKARQLKFSKPIKSFKYSNSFV